MQTIRISSEWKIILPFALAKLLLHLLTASNFEFHIDEFFYLYLGQYPDVGYYSAQPLTGLLSMTTQELLGNNTFIIRMVPAFFGMLSILILGRVVKLLNGNNTALIFTFTGYLLAPVFLRASVIFTPDFLDQFFWMLSTLLMVRLIKTKNTQNWILLGLVIGAGLLTKWSILILVTGFLIGVLVSNERKLLFSKELLIGAAICLLVLSPSLFWHFDHNFPYFREVSKSNRAFGSEMGVLWYFVTQLFMNLPGILIWGAGIVYVFISKTQTFLRPVGIGLLIALFLGVFVLSHPYYIAGIYPFFLASGGKAIELWLEKRSSLLKWRTLIFSVALGLPILPLSVPVFKLESMKFYSKYVKEAGINFPFVWVDGKEHLIPQFYGKMKGWDDLNMEITNFWSYLSPEEKRSTVIYVEDHKIACAIDYFTRNAGIPAPICFSDNFIFHNPYRLRVNNIIYIGLKPEEWASYFSVKETLKTNKKDSPFLNYNMYYLKDAQNSLERFYVTTSTEKKFNLE